ncbi:Protein of unknown function [Gryllus bimaculatus]|nr:Protein of unknown function [Gryllus bimaculatus]
MVPDHQRKWWKKTGEVTSCKLNATSRHNFAGSNGVSLLPPQAVEDAASWPRLIAVYLTPLFFSSTHAAGNACTTQKKSNVKLKEATRHCLICFVNNPVITHTHTRVKPHVNVRMKCEPSMSIVSSVLLPRLSQGVTASFAFRLAPLMWNAAPKLHRPTACCTGASPPAASDGALHNATLEKTGPLLKGLTAGKCIATNTGYCNYTDLDRKDSEKSRCKLENGENMSPKLLRNRSLEDEDHGRWLHYVDSRLLIKFNIPHKVSPTHEIVRSSTSTSELSRTRSSLRFWCDILKAAARVQKFRQAHHGFKEMKRKYSELSRLSSAK